MPVTQRVLLCSIALSFCPINFALFAQVPGRDSIQKELNIPGKIGLFELKNRRRFEDGSLMLRYVNSASFSADVFLSSGPGFDEDCDLACATKVLHQEVDGFKSAIPEMIQRKYFDTASVLRDDTLTFPPGSLWRLGRHLLLSLRKDSETRLSDYYLFYLPGYRIKVRSTYVSDSANALKQLLADLPAALTARDTTVREKHISISTKMAGGITTVVPRVIAALTRLGYSIADSSVQSGRIITAPVSDQAMIPGALQSNGKPWPSEVITVYMAQKGDLVELMVTAVPGNYQTDEKRNMTVELIALSRVMGELRKEGAN